MFKKFKVFVLMGGVLWLTQAYSSEVSRRVVEFKVEKIGEKTHWVPETVAVSPGEKIQIKAYYTLDGGFDFHGLSIPELKINKKVERRKTLSFDVDVPQTGFKELSVNCQFHPAHVGAKILVK
jgi:hypothetical protein